MSVVCVTSIPAAVLETDVVGVLEAILVTTPGSELVLNVGCSVVPPLGKNKLKVDKHSFMWYVTSLMDLMQIGYPFQST